MKNPRMRARNAMLGLAIGDALSWPAMLHRSYLLPLWTRRIRREINASSELTNALPFALPFSLNSSSEVLALGPTDDTEWATFSALELLRNNGEVDAQRWLAAWLELARSSQPVRGRIGAQAALHNLRKGKRPPHSGHDNPHYFDDNAVARAIPIGIICPGRPENAARMAIIDAEITNSEDGVWAAQAMAAAMSAACHGENVETVIARALDYLPAESWIKRTVQEALSFCDDSISVLEMIPRLSDAVVNREYNYGNVAPETFALTLAIIRQTQGRFEAAMLMSKAFAKTADSVPAFVAALCGAMSGEELWSAGWRTRLQKLHGICIPTLAGVNFIEVVEQLAELAAARAPA